MQISKTIIDFLLKEQSCESIKEMVNIYTKKCFTNAVMCISASVY